MTGRHLRWRRQQLDVALRDAGLFAGPRRLAVEEPDGDHARRLRQVLAASGPIASAFGAYLGGRADLLPIADCLELAGLGEVAPPLAEGQLEDALVAELGRPLADVVAELDPEPIELGLLEQTHRGRLKDGAGVLFRLRRPELAELDLETELAALAGLAPALAGRSAPRGLGGRGEAADFAGAFAAARADFRRALDGRLDGLAQAAALEFLARDVENPDLLVVPRVHRSLSTPGLLVVDDLGGVDLRRKGARSAYDANDLARRLCLMWLHQALIGGSFPVDCRIVELDDGRLAVTSGELAVLPAPARVSLWDYLRATASHFPDRAAGSLRRELSRPRGATAEGELRSRLRQAIPFRDGGWSAAGEELAEMALLHWRLSYLSGYRSPPHLVAFYRGLLSIARGAHRLDPTHDAPREALGQLGWLAGWNQLRQLSAPPQALATAESYAKAMLELPPKFERALDLASRDGHPFRLAATPPVEEDRRDRWASVAGLVMALVAVAVVSVRLGGTGWAEGWGERVAAIAVAALAGWLLWILGRWR